MEMCTIVFILQAGIPAYQLMIALEPEAASIYCKHLPVEKLEGSNSICAFQPGSKYLVLDAGGNVALERENERERERIDRQIICMHPSSLAKYLIRLLLTTP